MQLSNKDQVWNMLRINSTTEIRPIGHSSICSEIIYIYIYVCVYKIFLQYTNKIQLLKQHLVENSQVLSCELDSASAVFIVVPTG